MLGDITAKQDCLGGTMNSRITEIHIKPISEHEYRVTFWVDDSAEPHWVVYEAVDELDVYNRFKNFINFTYPERTS